jgi:peptide deformylase
MAVLNLVYHPNPILSTPTKKVEDFGASLKKMLTDMWDTHYAQKNCAGIAANQVGLPWAITVIDFNPDVREPLQLINPEIIEYSKDTTCLSEGCMSFPGEVFASVTRAAAIKVRYQDELGAEHVMEADGFMAKAIQHEVDHLNGILYIDRLPPLKRKMLENKYYRRQKKHKG